MPKNPQKCIFFKPFSPFLANNLFSKILLRSPLDTIKSYLDTKNQKKTMESFERNLSGHMYMRTYVRTSANLIGPPKFLGSVQKLPKMPKYKVNFVCATFKPQLLGEKIVQRLTVNGTHCANTSRKNMHSNCLVYVSNTKKNTKFYAKRVKINLNPS